MEELRLLLYPLPLALVLILLGAIGMARGRRLAGLVFFLALVGLGAAATEPVAQYVVGTLEDRYAAVAADSVEPADAIVVLGGGTRPAQGPRGEPQLGAAGDRLRAAHALYEAGRAPRVITTGAPPPQRLQATSEAEAAASILASWGVPEDALLTRGETRSTRDDRRAVRRVMATEEVESLILVTSAMHMPRAMALFEADGLDVTPAPADFAGYPDRPRHWTDLVPNARNLWLTRLAAHEYYAMLHYRLRGWID